ncbi:MAG: tetratricopeptide repeat protein [Myxococcales bacterium]|nr:tetratricopeptide repeat protein [Myxococcales bacterium]
MNKTLTISLFLVLWLLPAIAGAGPEEDAARLRRLYEQGQVAEADPQLAEFLQSHPADEIACPLELSAALAVRSVYDAKTRLRQTADHCATRPEGVRALVELARLLQLAGYDRPALAVCEEFFTRYPDAEDAPAMLLLKGSLELRLPLGATAGDSFAAFLAKYPDHPAIAEALAGLAGQKIRQGDWRGAEEAYRRALATDAGALDLPQVYFHLGLAAEKLGQKDAARHYYRELTQRWSDSLFAWRAKDRLDSTLAVGERLTVGPPEATTEKYAVSVGLYATLAEAEQAAKRFSEAGMRIHLLLNGQQCELLVGEFDSEQTALVFAQELGKRYQVATRPKRLP